jgi:hypothetical protein
MPQTSYVRPIARNGQLARLGPKDIDSYVNPLLAQITSILWAGTTNDATYSMRIQADGVDITIDFVPGGATTPDAVAVGLTAAALVDPVLTDMLNVGTVADAVADTTDTTFIHPGIVYTVTAIIGVGGNGTGTVTNDTDAGGTAINLGVAVAVVAGDDTAAAAVVAGTTDLQVAGITVLNTEAEVNTGVQTDVDNFLPGDEMSVARSGVFWLLVEDAVTKGGAVFFRNDNATGQDEAIGRLRSDVDGGDATALTGAKFGTSTTGAGLAEVKLNRP